MWRVRTAKGVVAVAVMIVISGCCFRIVGRFCG